MQKLINLSDDIQQQAYDRFWVAMGEIYGEQFFTEFGPEMPDQWRMAVGSLNLEQIKRGIDLCRDSGDSYIPRLPQFMGRARTAPQRSPEAQKRITSGKASTEVQERLHAFVERHREDPSRGVRSVLHGGESMVDYKAALSKARRNGKTTFEFKWERLNANGWTMEDEKRFYDAAKVCGISLYNGTTNLLRDCNE